MELAILFALLAANAAFAMAEMALASARRGRLQLLAEQGDAAAAAALHLKRTPERFLSTIQVGISLVGILAGAYGGATLARPLIPLIAKTPLVAPYAAEIAFGGVVLFITVLNVILGEIVPKRIAMAAPETLARFFARPLTLLGTISSPLIWFLSRTSAVVLWLIGVRPADQSVVSEEEIRLIIAEGAEAGILEAEERVLVERVMRLADRRAETLMTPRTQLAWVDLNAGVGDNMRLMSAAGHTYFPACDGDLDRAIGVVSSKDLWRRLVSEKQVPDLRACVMAVPHVPESMPALRLLEAFKKGGRHVALVFDEYGGLSGLVTIHDVLEAIVGGLPDQPGEPAELVIRRDDHSWFIDGMLPMDELGGALGEPDLPEPEADYETVAGLVLGELGRLPRTGEFIDWGGYRFEVVDLDGFRIDQLLVTRLNHAAPPVDSSKK